MYSYIDTLRANALQQPCKKTRQTYGQTDRPTDGQTDRQTGRQADRQTGRQAERRQAWRGEGGWRPPECAPHHSGSAILARRRGENAKIGHLAPLLGKPIDSCGMAMQDTFCTTKHKVLENGCPFSIRLPHHYDQIP